MKKYKVSIIVPVYNTEKYIEGCLQSLINQTHNKIEIILINDGSTDKSDEKIQKYINKKSNIIYINQFNQGATVARNRGLEVATGDYIMFFDSDDILELDAIEIMLKKNKDNDMIVGNYQIINESDNLVRSKKVLRGEVIDKRNIFRNYYSLPPTLGNKLFKTSIIRENNITFSNLKIGQDLSFYLKFLSMAKSVCAVDNYIFRYRIVNNSMSRTYSSNILNIVDSIKDIKKYMQKHNKQELIDRYISVIELFHYNEQMSKLVCFDNKEDRRIILLYFKKYIKRIKFDKMDDKADYKTVLMKVRIKLLLWRIYISDFYRKMFLYRIEKKGE